MADRLVTEASNPIQASVAPRVRTKYKSNSGPAAHMPMAYKNVLMVIWTKGRTFQDALKNVSHSLKNVRQSGTVSAAPGGASDTLTFHRYQQLRMPVNKPKKNMAW